MEPLLDEEEKDNIEKWLPKFKEAYHNSSYVYLPVSVKDYHMLIDGEWYFIESGIKDKPEGFTQRFPAKEPEGRMITLEDVTPDFLTDPAERDTSLIKILGYGQEYFEEG